jgi:hypothetical protein
MLGNKHKEESGQRKKAGGHVGYVSEFAQFMNQFLNEHPDVVNKQLDGWNIFWDHQVDLEELKKASTDTIPVKDYNYF